MFLRQSASGLSRAAVRGVKINTSVRNKYTLVLVRHGESTWNKENKFTGWWGLSFLRACFQQPFLCSWVQCKMMYTNSFSIHICHLNWATTTDFDNTGMSVPYPRMEILKLQRLEHCWRRKVRLTLKKLLHALHYLIMLLFLYYFWFDQKRLKDEGSKDHLTSGHLSDIMKSCDHSYHCT